MLPLRFLLFFLFFFFFSADEYTHSGEVSAIYTFSAE